MAEIITLKCFRCGVAFDRKARRVRTASPRHYCSHACRDAKVRRTCEACGLEFLAKPGDLKDRPVRFCSKACQRVGMATPVITCKGCGRGFKRTGVGNRATFCSHHCYANWLSESGVMSGENSRLWLGGLGWNSKRGPSWSRQRRKAMRRDGHQCARCGAKRDEVDRLHVHHRIPFRVFQGDHEAANDLGNLITLCTSCHTTTEWELRQGVRLF